MLIHSKELLMSGGGSNQVYLNILTSSSRNSLFNVPLGEVAWVSKKPESRPSSGLNMLGSTESVSYIDDRIITSLNEKVSVKTASLEYSYIRTINRQGFFFDFYFNTTWNSGAYVLQGSKLGEALFPSHLQFKDRVEGNSDPVHHVGLDGNMFYTCTVNGVVLNKKTIFGSSDVAKSYLVTYKES